MARQARFPTTVSIDDVDYKVKKEGDQIQMLSGQKLSIVGWNKTQNAYVLENRKKLPIDQTKNVGRGCFEVDEDGNKYGDSKPTRKPKTTNKPSRNSRNVERKERGEKPSKISRRRTSERTETAEKKTKKLESCKEITPKHLEELKEMLDKWSQKLLNSTGTKYQLAFNTAVLASEYEGAVKLVIGILPTFTDTMDVQEFTEKYFENIQTLGEEDEEETENELADLEEEFEDELDDSEEEEDEPEDELKTEEECISDIEQNTNLEKINKKYIREYMDGEFFDETGIQVGDVLVDQEDDSDLIVLLGYSEKHGKFVITEIEGEKAKVITPENLERYEIASLEEGSDEGDLEEEEEGDEFETDTGDFEDFESEL